MTRIFDRYLIDIFVRAFLICFSSLVGLYIVIDAFANLDEFSERSPGLFSLLATMGEYYLYRVSLFFDRLAGVITTIAAMFTFSWIQRTNELMPMLAAGVPIYRIISPVLVAAMLICGVTCVNQELLIPRISQQLQGRADDDPVRSSMVRPTYDSNGILIGGDRFYRDENKIRPAYVTVPRRLAGALLDIRAREAEYVSPGEGQYTGGWILVDTTPAEIQCNEQVVAPMGPGQYFLHTSATFEQLSRQQSWFQYSSTRDLLRAIQLKTATNRAEMEVLFHSRLTRPLATLTLLLLGIPFVLSGTTRRMVSLVGMSLVISVTFHLFSQFCQRLGNIETIPPELAAWLPVLLFGSLAVGLFDLVKT